MYFQEATIKVLTVKSTMTTVITLQKMSLVIFMECLLA